MSNEIVLQKFFEKQEKLERSLELLTDKLDERMYELSIEIQRIIKIASDYDGLDFSAEFKESIRDMI
jgi:hypothetical protein